jgi:hypothetical protein
MPDRPMPAPRTPDPALPSEAGKLPPITASKHGPGKTHRDAINSHDYWREFIGVVYFDDEPFTLEGRVTELGRAKATLDKTEVWVPKVTLETDAGRTVEIPCRQARLRAEIIRLRPALGERLRIEYGGSAGRSVGAYSPAKQFTVSVPSRKAAQ